MPTFDSWTKETRWRMTTPEGQALTDKEATQMVLFITRALPDATDLYRESTDHNAMRYVWNSKHWRTCLTLSNSLLVERAERGLLISDDETRVLSNRLEKLFAGEEAQSVQPEASGSFVSCAPWEYL